MSRIDNHAKNNVRAARWRGRVRACILFCQLEGFSVLFALVDGFGVTVSADVKRKWEKSECGVQRRSAHHLLKGGQADGDDEEAFPLFGMQSTSMTMMMTMKAVGAEAAATAFEP